MDPSYCIRCVLALTLCDSRWRLYYSCIAHCSSAIWLKGNASSWNLLVKERCLLGCNCRGTYCFHLECWRVSHASSQKDASSRQTCTKLHSVACRKIVTAVRTSNPTCTSYFSVPTPLPSEHISHQSIVHLIVIMIIFSIFMMISVCGFNRMQLMSTIF
jgi:hypothetical protein